MCCNEYWKAEHYLWSTFRNYTHSEPRLRALLSEDGANRLVVVKR